MSRKLTMTCHAKRYLAHRRALGFALEGPGRLLLDFARFADQPQHRGPLTTDLALRWATLRPDAAPRYQAHRLSAVRGFARYLSARDERTEIPPAQLLGPCVIRIQPHIYSDSQLRQVIAAAASLPAPYPLRPRTYSVLLGLLSCTGLRISEALNLARKDVDLKQGILRIEKTKFQKSRLVPLHPSATKSMHGYARIRDRDPLAQRSDDFFVAGEGRAPHRATVNRTFRSLCDDLGLVGNGAWPKPRIHDLRHTFACRRIMAWYEQGVEINHAIAALSTYLGHASVANTYWYLTGVPQLMGIAGDRFEQFAAPRNGGRS